MEALGTAAGLVDRPGHGLFVSFAGTLCFVAGAYPRLLR